MKTNKISQVIEVYRQLKKISRGLNNLGCYQCNVGELTKRQEAREQKLVDRAEELARLLGVHAYHQTDPRGCSLYLIESRKLANTNYSSGVAIY